MRKTEHEPKGSSETEQVTTQWVMEARCSTMAADVCREDVVLFVETVEAGSEASVVPTAAELPSSLSIALSADVAKGT